MPDRVTIEVRTDDEQGQRGLRETSGELRRLGSTAKTTSRDVTSAKTREAAANRRSSGSYKELARQMGITEKEARKLAANYRTSARAAADHTRATDRASRSQRLLGTSTRTLSTQLRSAAKYAIAAGGAYLGISQIKSAITATTDLAKASLVLTKNLGFTAETASTFGAVAIARGADSRSLGMAFNTLSGQVVKAKDGTESAVETFDKLGVSQRELIDSSPEEMLFRVVDGLGKLGKGFERTATLRTLFGRGAQTLGPLLRGGSVALREQLADAQALGAVFSKLGLKDMEDVIAAQRRLKLAQMGLQVSFTQAVTPAIIAASDRLAEWSRILNDPRLSGSEKFDRIAKDINAAISRATPMIAENAARMAPAVASGFVKGFLAAPAMGQLLVGGWLLTKLGGLGAFRGIGGKAGGKFALGFLGGVAVFGLASELKEQLGDDLEAPSTEKLGDQLREQMGSLIKGVGIMANHRVRVATEFGDLIFNAETQRVVRAKGKQLQALVGATAADATQGLDRLKHGFTAATKSLGSFKVPPATVGGVRSAFDQMNNVVRTRTNSMAELTKGQMAAIKRAMKSSPEEGRMALTTAMDDATQAIRKAMKENRITTEEGMAQIQQIMEAKSTLFGFKGLSDLLKVTPGSIKEIPQAKPGKGAQRGRVIPGSGVGDKVLTPTEPGEVVWNREAVKKMGGPQIANRPNELFPRFGRAFGVGGPRDGRKDRQAAKRAAKGKIGMPRWSPSGLIAAAPAGALNTTAVAAEGILKRARERAAKRGGALGGDKGTLDGEIRKMALGFGLTMTSGFRPGDDGWHGSDRARDWSNGYATKQELGFAQKVAARFGSNLLELIHTPLGYGIQNGARVAPYATADHYDHVHVAMQRGGIVALARGLQGGGIVGSPRWGKAWIKPKNPSRWTVDEAATLVSQAGGTAREARALSSKLLSESGGNPRAHGPPDGRGLFQVERQFHPEVKGWDLFDPYVNAKAALLVLRKQGIGAWYGASGQAGKINKALIGQSGGAGGSTLKDIVDAWKGGSSEFISNKKGMLLSQKKLAAKLRKAGAPKKKAARLAKKMRKKALTGGVAAPEEAEAAETPVDEAAAALAAAELARQTAIAEANRQVAADLAANLALSESGYGVIPGMLSELVGGQQVGAFGSQATLTPKLPAAVAAAARPTGLSTTTVPGILKSAGGPTIILNGDIGKHIQVRAKGMRKMTDKKIGRKARKLAFSPGRR